MDRVPVDGLPGAPSYQMIAPTSSRSVRPPPMKTCFWSSLNFCFKSKWSELYPSIPSSSSEIDVPLEKSSFYFCKPAQLESEIGHETRKLVFVLFFRK